MELSFLKLRDYIKMNEDVKGKSSFRIRIIYLGIGKGREREKIVYKKCRISAFFLSYLIIITFFYEARERFQEQQREQVPQGDLVKSVLVMP